MALGVPLLTLPTLLLLADSCASLPAPAPAPQSSSGGVQSGVQGSVQGGAPVPAPQGAAQGGVPVPPAVPHSTTSPGIGGVRKYYTTPASSCIDTVEAGVRRFNQYSRGRGYRDWRTRGDPTLINSLWRSRQPLGIRKQLGNAEVYIVLALLIGFVTVVVGCWLSDNCWSPEPEDVLAGP